MALFKISKGKSTNLPANKVNGYCYVTTDEHKLYVDYTKDDGTLDRFALNATSADQWKTARNLNGMIVNGTSNVVNYGTCSTAAETAAKVVSCSNFALITGAEITVKFITTNTASNPTLNVNNTGAKAIYYRGSAIGRSYLAANRTYTFRYNGTQYELVGDISVNTKVTQTITTSDESYPLLLAPSGQTATTTTTSYFDSEVSLNPSTNTITANISGNAATATALTTNAGSLRQPVYFNEGKPVVAADDYVFYDETTSSTGGADAIYVKLTGDTMTGTLTASKFIGPLQGTATQAIQDGNGNVISSTYFPLSGGTLTGAFLGMQIPSLSNKMEMWINDIDTCLTCTNNSTNNKMVLSIKESSKELCWQYYTASTDSWESHKLWKSGDAVTGAVWNDYAEYRESDCEEFGYVLMETGDDSLTKTTERLSHFAGVSSDTWGFSQGETEHARTPIAVAGRVLVYPYQDRNNYKPGDCVCAAPGGTVDIMTREEIIQYPDRIVGTVSCVPDYKEWGGGKNADRPSIQVDNRIWIKVR